jgi:hypothetical protein
MQPLRLKHLPLWANYVNARLRESHRRHYAALMRSQLNQKRVIISPNSVTTADGAANADGAFEVEGFPYGPNHDGAAPPPP